MSLDIVRELKDYTYLKWSHGRNSSGTVGTFLKAADIVGGEKIYYKMSNYDPEKGVIGHECINEIIVDRLLRILGIQHVSYILRNATVSVGDKTFDTYICGSKDFKKPGESKIALDDYYGMNRLPGESRIDFVIRNGWEGYIYEMLVVDFLIINRDRHGANIEVLKEGREKRIAPLFDHGLSLLFSASNEADIKKFDPMADMPVQSFVGGRSLFDNLSMIHKEHLPRLRHLDERDRDDLFEDLQGIISDTHMDKIWKIIWERWCYYENLRNT